MKEQKTGLLRSVLRWSMWGLILTLVIALQSFSPAQADQAPLLNSSELLLKAPSGVTLRLIGSQVIRDEASGRFIPQISAELTNGSEKSLYLLYGLAPEQPYLRSAIVPAGVGGAGELTVCGHHFLFWNWDCFTFAPLCIDNFTLSTTEVEDPCLIGELILIDAGLLGGPDDGTQAPSDVMVALVATDDLEKIASALNLDPDVAKKKTTTLGPGKSALVLLRAPIHVVDAKLVPKPITIGVTLADGQGSNDTQVFECSLLGVCSSTLPPLPDLALEMTLDTKLIVGQPVTFTATVANIGGAPTTGTISVTDALPSTLSLVSLSANGFFCFTFGQQMTCQTSAVLAPGQSLPIQITVRLAGGEGKSGPEAGTEIKNCAKVRTEGDVNLDNDQGCVTGKVE
jgi:uncharacterized repeat protein (TIGR01451 family)